MTVCYVRLLVAHVQLECRECLTISDPHVAGGHLLLSTDGVVGLNETW